MKSIKLLPLIVISIFFSTFPSAIFANDSIDIDVYTETLKLGLKTVVIETEDSKEPSFDIVSPPWGGDVVSITNVEKVHARLFILSEQGDTLYDTKPYIKDSLGVTIKVRGNSSATKPKKSFKLKLQKSGDLLLRQDTTVKTKDKEWALIRTNCDYPYTSRPLHNWVGLQVNELIGMQWTPQFEYVNLIMNGDYRGIYSLMETVERNKSCRIRVDKDGYIVELDPYWWNEPLSFETSLYPDKKYKYTFKYPEDKDVTEEQVEYIRQWILNFENNISNGDYVDYIDVESWSRWILAQDILGNFDSGGSNMFFTKEDSTDSTLLMMGNLWDFDAIERTANKWSNVHNDFYWATFFDSDLSGIFVRAYKKIYKEESQSIFNELEKKLKAIKTSSLFNAFSQSMAKDRERWGTESNSTMQEIIDANLNWFRSRKKWMDQNVEALTSSAMYSISISDALWTTVCVPFDINVPEDLEFYTIDSVDDNGKINGTLVSTALANKPYLVHGAKGTYEFSGQYIDLTNADELTQGCLTGVLEDGFVPQNKYVLQNINDVVGFYLVKDANSIKITSNHAYLTLNKQASYVPIRVPNDVTDIHDIINMSDNSNLNLLNSWGQPVRQKDKGLYLKKSSNGSYRKIIIK